MNTKRKRSQIDDDQDYPDADEGSYQSQEYDDERKGKQSRSSALKFKEMERLTKKYAMLSTLNDYTWNVAGVQQHIPPLDKSKLSISESTNYSLLSANMVCDKLIIPNKKHCNMFRNFLLNSFTVGIASTAVMMILSDTNLNLIDILPENLANSVVNTFKPIGFQYGALNLGTTMFLRKGADLLFPYVEPPTSSSSCHVETCSKIYSYIYKKHFSLECKTNNPIICRDLYLKKIEELGWSNMLREYLRLPSTLKYDLEKPNPSLIADAVLWINFIKKINGSAEEFCLITSMLYVLFRSTNDYNGLTHTSELAQEVLNRLFKYDINIYSTAIKNCFISMLLNSDHLSYVDFMKESVYPRNNVNAFVKRRFQSKIWNSIEKEAVIEVSIELKKEIEIH